MPRSTQKHPRHCRFHREEDHVIGSLPLANSGAPATSTSSAPMPRYSMTPSVTPSTPYMSSCRGSPLKIHHYCGRPPHGESSSPPPPQMRLACRPRPPSRLPDAPRHLQARNDWAATTLAWLPLMATPLLVWAWPEQCQAESGQLVSARVHNSLPYFSFGLN
jgi:hypothetical protein